MDPHTDNTFLITKPLSVLGVWVAIEDANKFNGCMWGVPKSHLTQTTKFFHKNKEETETLFHYADGHQKECNEEGAVVLEAKKGMPIVFNNFKGSVILLHGDFVHFSRDNVSDKARPAYTMHFVESD